LSAHVQLNIKEAPSKPHIVIPAEAGIQQRDKAGAHCAPQIRWWQTGNFASGGPACRLLSLCGQNRAHPTGLVFSFHRGTQGKKLHL
jgi:hypothetical protein